MFKRRSGLTILLAAGFLLNFLETWLETVIDHIPGAAPANLVAHGLHSLENNYVFDHHDLTNRVAIYGYSISYYFLLSFLGLALAFVFAQRKSVQPYRVFATAIAIVYLISLPFFLFFPVPERWAYPDSGAMLLSDLWSTKLFESIRPISGLDNSFPSFHVSSMVVIILTSYLFKVRFRHSVCALGLTVILSTFVLGVHWIPDMLAGTVVGILAVSIACLLEFARANSLLGVPRKLTLPRTLQHGLD